jgi:hypothetical protein
MNWANEPATWKQLKYLRQAGYHPDHPLTKTEAAELIRNFGGDPEAQVAGMANSIREMTEETAAYHLRTAVDQAQSGVAKAMAIARRQEFWVDTCLQTPHAGTGAMQSCGFYRKYGCRFEAPRPHEVQFILDALDSAMPLWDRDHPELFYQTLEINFPQLLKRT